MQYNTVQWRYKGGAGIQWLRDNLQGCGEFDVVIISIGGNDLDNGTAPAVVASELITLASLCADRGVRKTVVMAIWPRESPFFETPMMTTNTALDDGLNTEDKRVAFWKQERRLRFEFYDGVHLRHYYGARRYLLSCIMWADKQLRRLR